jgi:hypothetical protein
MILLVQGSVGIAAPLTYRNIDELNKILLVDYNVRSEFLIRSDFIPDTDSATHWIRIRIHNRTFEDEVFCKVV